MTNIAPFSVTLLRYPRRDGVYSVLPDAVIVHDRYQNRHVRLDPFGAELWLRIDGMTTLHEIAIEIAVSAGLPVEEVARSASAMIGALSAEGILYVELEPQPQPYHLTMPLDEQDPYRAAASMRAEGWF